MRIVTWNMEGGNASTENKWNTGALNILQNLPADIICLQECGGVPPSATYVGAYDNGLELYTWGGTRTRPGAWILFFAWDRGGNRCNLAVVSRTEPEDPRLLYPAGNAHRPVIGAEYDGVYVFSIHAISGGGWDAQGLLNAVVGENLAQWVVAGDFNRIPDNTFPQGAWIVCPPNGVTRHASERMLDYAVVSANYGGQVIGQVLSLQMSDHWPVCFDFVRR